MCITGQYLNDNIIIIKFKFFKLLNGKINNLTIISIL